jgi:hypothetical protein
MTITEATSKPFSSLKNVLVDSLFAPKVLILISIDSSSIITTSKQVAPYFARPRSQIKATDGCVSIPKHHL